MVYPQLQARQCLESALNVLHATFYRDYASEYHCALAREDASFQVGFQRHGDVRYVF